MKVVAIRVGICPLCSRPVLDTQRHVVNWEEKDALFFHEACIDRSKDEREETPTDASLTSTNSNE